MVCEDFTAYASYFSSPIITEAGQVSNRTIPLMGQKLARQIWTNQINRTLRHLQSRALHSKAGQVGLGLDESRP